MKPILTAALDFIHHGCSVVPIRPDGSKSPAVAWKAYTVTAPSESVVTEWFADGAYDGLGVVCGAVSGNLEMFEVESYAVDLVQQLQQLLTDNGFSDLWDRLCRGYLVQSPSGGLHWTYRVVGPARRNTKIARRPATEEELRESPDEKVKVLIETRGQGGQFVTAPSAGRTHPTGKPWVVLAGSPAGIPAISVNERDALYAIAAVLDEMPTDTAPEAVMLPGDPPGAVGTRPGDDYNANATWDDILVPRGWRRTKKFGHGLGWTRPGKEARDGISATTGTSADGADRLYVFSTSTEFDTEKPYSKFAAYTLLEHAGDYAAAAKALGTQGYGKTPEQPRPSSTPPQSQPATAAVVEPATYSLTDDGNALRLVDAHAETIRHCGEWGAWLMWDGHRWRRDHHDRVNELARRIARKLPSADKAEVAHRKWSLSARGLAAMTRVAHSDPRITVSITDLDSRAYELNTPAGVVDLRTGQLRPPDPSALHTRSTAVSPDSTTPPTRWLTFLADTFAGDPALATYVQRLLGLSLIGEVREAILPFGWGAGANGKSTLLNVAQGVLGVGDDGYAIPAPAELLLATNNRSHPTEIARLAGARLVVASELEEGERFAEARIKLLTGKDNLVGRFMARDFFSFTPTHTIWLLANEQPSVRAGGPAFWRRLRLIDFVHVVPPNQRITGLDDLLTEEEGPAILAWMIAGAVQYLQCGLTEPHSVKVATERYEHDQDHLARFVEECCQIGDPNAQHMTVHTAKLRARYEGWCRQEGEPELSSKALTTQLRNRFGVKSSRSKTTRYYSGISVTDEESDTDKPSNNNEQWWQK